MTEHYELAPSLLAAKETPSVELLDVGAGHARPLRGQRRDGGLVEYFRLWRRQRDLLLTVALLGAVMGFAVWIARSPLYPADVVVEIRGVNPGFLNLRDATPVATGGEGAARLEIPSHMRILRSRFVLDGVRERVGMMALGEMPEGGQWSWPARLRYRLGLEPSSQAERMEQALRTAERNLDVVATADARILEVRTRSTEPRVAAAFVNLLVDEYVQHAITARSQSAHRTSEWLDAQVGVLRARLEDSEQRLQDYAQEEGLLFTEPHGSVAEENLHQLQAELSRARSDRIRRESRYRLVRQAPVETLPEVVVHGPLRDYHVKLVELRRQLAEMDAIYTPAHAKVKQVQAQIAEITRAVEEERQTVVQQMANEWDAARHRENLLQQDYDGQAERVTVLSAKEIEYRLLQREVQTNREIYDNLLKKVREASVAAGVNVNNIQILDRAVPATGPVGPEEWLYVSMGMMCGLFLGGMGIVARDRVAGTLKRPGEVSVCLGARELGVVPSCPVLPSGWRGKSQRKLVVRLVSGPVERPLLRRRMPRIVERMELPERVELMTWRHPSPLAESFRAVRTSILLSGRHGQRPSVIVVTSPYPEEGKTTVTSNLALALAEIGLRTLVIDADLRRPRLHDVLGMPNQWGLANLLHSARPVYERPFDALAQETSIPRLYLLSSGSGGGEVSRLLCSERLNELLAWARQEFDAVLIDTPPVLPVADARILGARSDGVLLVVRAHKTTYDAARAAFDRLSADGTHLLGAVLNRWDPRHDGYGEYRADAKPYGAAERVKPGKRRGKPAGRHFPPVGMLNLGL